MPWLYNLECEKSEVYFAEVLREEGAFAPTPSHVRDLIPEGVVRLWRLAFERSEEMRTSDAFHLHLANAWKIHSAA